MKCPHCNLAINFIPSDNSTYPYPDFNQSEMCYGLVSGICPACKDLIVSLERGLGSYGEGDYYLYKDHLPCEQIIFPLNSTRFVESEVPSNYKDDFLEACAVLPISPKASAALSRRMLQNILREEFKVKHSDLAKEIEEFIQTKNAPSYLNDEIDAIRNIGNFAAHPTKDTNTGAIADVEPGEAEWLIEVLESLFDFAFVQPKRSEERRKKLNDKLKDLGKPPMKKK